MNVEIFKRNIKLQELGIGKLSNKEQELLDFLNDNLRNLNTYTSNSYTLDEYEDYLFFGKDKDNILLNYNVGNGHLYVNYNKVWSFFESEFDMEYDEIRELIQCYVIDTLHLNVYNTLAAFAKAMLMLKIP